MDNKKAKARRLVDLMDMSGKCIRYLKTLIEKFPNGERIFTVASEIAEEHMEELRDAIGKVYAEHLKEETIEDLIKFYESDSGKQFSDVRTEMEKAVTSAATPWYQSVLDDTTEELLKKELKEAADRGPNWSNYIPPLDYFHSNRK